MKNFPPLHGDRQTFVKSEHNQDLRRFSAKPLRARNAGAGWVDAVDIQRTRANEAMSIIFTGVTRRGMKRISIRVDLSHTYINEKGLTCRQYRCA